MWNHITHIPHKSYDCLNVECLKNLKRCIINVNGYHSDR